MIGSKFQNFEKTPAWFWSVVGEHKSKQGLSGRRLIISWRLGGGTFIVANLRQTVPYTNGNLVQQE